MMSVHKYTLFFLMQLSCNEKVFVFGYVLPVFGAGIKSHVILKTFVLLSVRNIDVLDSRMLEFNIFIPIAN